MVRGVWGLWIACVLLGLWGCSPGASNETEGAKPGSEAAQSSGSASDEGVQVMSPAAGPMSPVTGSDTVTGTGGGVGDAMKSKARDVAASSPSSLDSAGSEDGP